MHNQMLSALKVLTAYQETENQMYGEVMEAANRLVNFGTDMINRSLSEAERAEATTSFAVWSSMYKAKRDVLDRFRREGKQ